MDFAEILKPGLAAEIQETVTDKITASAWGSGGLDVLATPAMIALMEKAAMTAVAPHLPAGWSTVGTEVNIKHLSATPVGMKVTVKAKLLGVDGRALFFKVEASDETGEIGGGTHGRFVVENERFIAKVEGKKALRGVSP